MAVQKENRMVAYLAVAKVSKWVDLMDTVRVEVKADDLVHEKVDSSVICVVVRSVLIKVALTVKAMDAIVVEGKVVWKGKL